MPAAQRAGKIPRFVFRPRFPVWPSYSTFIPSIRSRA